MAPTPDIQRLLDQIYGPEKGRAAFGRVSALIERFPARARRKTQRFSEKDVLLITYGDSLRKEGQRPLQTLHGFAERYLKDRFSGIHFLPFFPYSSDDGFSVMDFHTIDPGLGDWQDVRAVGQDFEMMFDFVINHFSAQGQWFADYLADVPGCRDLALEADPTADLSQVTRPRALPLLTPFTKHDGTTVHLWTTFSADQIDFNYRSLDVLEKMLAVMLRYVENGATLLRLDAIAYLWKEIGTPCIHLPQTHAMVKLFRAVLDAVAPDVIIVTETNVPHAENISYFGSGRDEAQMVYNFTLPPLLLHTFVTGDAAVLSEWARTLNLPSDETTFFNFTASHDGIGVRPLEGILPPAEVDALARHAEAMGGQVSRKNNPDGTQSPYELNVTYVDAILGDPGLEDAGKFMASQAIQYVLPGVPGTYIHSLIGSRNWIEGVNQTGRARTINREKPLVEAVAAELDTPGSFRARVFSAYLEMIALRRRQPAFHPKAAFEVLTPDPRVFAISRRASGQQVVAVTNVTGDPVRLAPGDCGLSGAETDLVSGSALAAKGTIDLAPFQSAWMTADPK
jgi:glycosidase